MAISMKIWYENLTCGATWTDIASTVLGEISRAQNGEFAVSFLRWVSQGGHIHRERMQSLDDGGTAEGGMGSYCWPGLVVL